MESACSETLLSASSDETEFHPNPKRVKIESNHKNTGKKDQQKIEQSTRPVNRCKTSLNESVCLAERQNDWVLEKETCDRKRRQYTREFFHIPTWNNENLQDRILKNKLPSKKWSLENEDGNIVNDSTPLNIHRQSFETELPNVWNVSKAGRNLHVANQPQLQDTSNVEPHYERNCDKELKNFSAVTPLNSDLFQLEMLSHKSVSDKKWQQYQLLQVPFLCDTNSAFSHAENEKNNFQKKVCTTEDKDCSSSDSETATERDNTENTNSSYLISTLKPFKSIQPLKIPDFLREENTFKFSGISGKLNNKMPSTSLKEMQWKNFASSMQCEKMNCALKISGIEEQLQSDKNAAEVSSIGSDLKEKSYQPVSKQEYALAERAQESLTYFSSNNTHSERSQTFSGNNCKDKMLENSDGDDDHKSRVPFQINVQILHNEKHISCTDTSKRTGRNRSNKGVTVFRIQESIPVISETFEKNNLNIYNGACNSKSSICLRDAESKLLTAEIIDFKRLLTKSIVFGSNCPHTIVQSFPAIKMSFTILRRKEQFKLKFSFRNILFGSFRSWTESLYKDTYTFQEDGLCSLNFCEILKEQYDTQELLNSNSRKSLSNNMCICVLGIISKHHNTNILETVFTSFFNKKSTSLPTEGKHLLVERPTLCSRKPIHLHLCINNSLRQNIEFPKKYENYSYIISPKLPENTNFDLHNECQKTDFLKLLDKEKKSYFLKKETLFCNKKSVLPSVRCFRKHRLLGSKGFLSTCSASIRDKMRMRRQLLVANCIILLEGSSEYSSLEKMYCSNIRKTEHLTGANLSFFNYLPTSSQMILGKLHSKCSNQQILLTVITQEKKPSKLWNSLLHGERPKSLSSVLSENKRHKTAGWRNSIKSANGVTCTQKECLDSSNYINPDRNEYVKSRDLLRKSQDFLSENSFSIFDTHKKIPLNTDSEDLDRIPLVKQDNLVKEKYNEDNTVTALEGVHNLLTKSGGVLILPEQSKITVEKCNSLQLHNSQTNQVEYCQKMDGFTSSPHLGNEKECVYYPDTDLSSGNTFPSLISSYPYVTSPLHESPVVNKNAVINGDGRCRNSLNVEKQKQLEKNHSTLQFPPAGSPTLTDTYLQRQDEEVVHFSLHGHTQTANTFSLEPATLKQNLEYVNEQEEISEEQMHLTNENQCEALMNDSIMPYSEDESKTFVAEEDKLRMNLSIMNNGCLEDVKDEYLPSESKIKYEFELKRKFDLVLEELRMFHEISTGNENHLSSVETNSCNSYCELNSSERMDENVKNVSRKKTCISFPICDTIERQNITVSSQSLLKKNTASGNEEKKVSNEYCISRRSGDSPHSPTAEGSFDSLARKSYTWDPAFLSCAFMKEQSCNLQKEGGYFLSHEVIKVQPLKTCRGPIRIGLSRKARPKQLHPYLK